jgi:hypothetical protein
MPTSPLHEILEGCELHLESLFCKFDYPGIGLSHGDESGADRTDYQIRRSQEPLPANSCDRLTPEGSRFVGSKQEASVFGNRKTGSLALAQCPAEVSIGQHFSQIYNRGLCEVPGIQRCLDLIRLILPGDLREHVVRHEKPVSGQTPKDVHAPDMSEIDKDVRVTDNKLERFFGRDTFTSACHGAPYQLLTPYSRVFYHFRQRP